jgi:hypothetical protein
VTSFTSAKIKDAINRFANTHQLRAAAFQFATKMWAICAFPRSLRYRCSQHLGFRPRLVIGKRHTQDSAIEKSIDIDFRSSDTGSTDYLCALSLKNTLVQGTLS